MDDHWSYEPWELELRELPAFKALSLPDQLQVIAFERRLRNQQEIDDAALATNGDPEIIKQLRELQKARL